MNPRREEEVLSTVKMLAFPKLVDRLGLRRICLGHSHPSLSPPPRHFPPFCEFHRGDQRVTLPCLCLWHPAYTSLAPPLLSNPPVSAPFSPPSIALLQLLSSSLLSPGLTDHAFRGLHSSSDRWKEGVWGGEGTFGDHP